MQKNYFHQEEINFRSSVEFIEFSEEKKLTEEVQKKKMKSLNLEVEKEEYTGPSLEEIKAEIQKERQDWEFERNEMIQAAEDEVKAILSSAKQEAKLITEESKKEQEALKKELLTYQEDRKKAVEGQCEILIKEAQADVVKIHEKARLEGYDVGKREGYDSGLNEIKRLSDRLHVVINKTIEKRNEIISESENQMVDLILQISRKVVKTISKNNEEVIVENTLEALDKLKVKSNVVVRANLNDIDILTEHKEQFIKNIEKLGNIEFIEDTSVDQGGCIVETDFGQIDARISSQLAEIERRIIDSIPVKTKGSSYRFK